VIGNKYIRIDSRISKALSVPVWILVSRPHVKGLRRQQDYTNHQHTGDAKEREWEVGGSKKIPRRLGFAGGCGNESKEDKNFLASRGLLFS
jgi:hypothetical protein